MNTITSTQLTIESLSGEESAEHALPDNPLARAALESTRLAIARWTGGIHLPQMLVPGMIRVSPQARWYAKANNDFQEWLERGGFAQDGYAKCDATDAADAADTADMSSTDEYID